MPALSISKVWSSPWYLLGTEAQTFSFLVLEIPFVAPWSELLLARTRQLSSSRQFCHPIRTEHGQSWDRDQTASPQWTFASLGICQQRKNHPGAKMAPAREERFSPGQRDPRSFCLAVQEFVFNNTLSLFKYQKPFTPKNI